MAIKHTTFQINKTKIAVWPIEGIRSVVCQIMIRAGSWYERGSGWGAFHLLEHLTNKATQKLPSPDDVENYKEKFAITSNAWTGGDTLGYWFKFPSDYLEQTLRFIEQVVFYPIFPPDQLEKEILVIDQESQEFWNSPYNRFGHKQFNQLMGRRHIYCRDAIGQVDFLKTLTPKKLSFLHQKFYQPQNMIMVFAGNVEPNRAKKEVEKILKTQKSSKKAKLRVPKLAPRRYFLKHRDKIEHPFVSVAWLFPGRDRLDINKSLVLNMGNFILGGGTRSLLFNRLRNQLGLVYGVESSVSILPTVGVLRITTSTSEENVEKVIGEIKLVVEKFLTEDISPKELDQIKHYMNLQTLMHYDSVDNIASGLASSLFYRGKTYTPEEYIEIASTITDRRIKRLFRKHLAWERAFVGVMLPGS